MTIKLRKIDYQVHMDQLDSEGNVIAEMSTQQPLSLYAHQLADLPEQVEAIIKQAEAQQAQV